MQKLAMNGILELLTKMLRHNVHRNIKRSDCGGVLIVVTECHNQNNIYNDKIRVVQSVEVN